MKKLLTAVIICLFSLSSFSVLAQSGTNTLAAGQKLTEGQRLVSADKKYYLTIQADGNLCIYTSSNNGFVWCSMMHFGKGSSLGMQTDGNLVVYDGKNKAVWSSMTQPWFDPKFSSAEWKPVRAVLENNGTFNLYNAANKKVWGNTDKPAPPVVSPGFGYTGPVVKKDLKIKLPGSNKATNLTVEVTERGDVIYQGDMNLGNIDDLTKKASAPTPAAEKSFKWPNSTVHYVLPTNHRLKATIEQAIKYMNAHTTICLVPRTTQTDYVEFMSDGKGNWATLGRVGGRQEISMTDDNMTVVMHEIMHALGFHHTQCREDRDNYVTINMGNVQKGMEHNFIKNTDPQTNLGAYDYNSIMHYFSSAFANRKGSKTITRKDGKTDEMGKFDGMSQTDVNNIAAVYAACSGKKVTPLLTTATTSTTPTSTTSAATCEAKDAVKKYQTSMKPGERLSGKEKIVSANGRFQFRITTDGNYVIEEVLSSGVCPYKEVYRFPLANGGSKPGVSFFSYNPDGNICMDSKQGKTHCVTTGKDATAGIILYKSVKLELTDDGRLRLVNKDGQEIWATAPGSKTNPTTQPTTNPTTVKTSDKFIKSKSVLNHDETLKLGQTLTSDNNQYQARIVKQSINVGGGRMQEQQRFIIDKITVTNGMITNRAELWNKKCDEGIGLPKNAIIFPDCFYETSIKDRIPVRTSRNYGQLKLENDGKIKVYYGGYYTAEVCPVEGKADLKSNSEVHFRTNSYLLSNERLEQGKTLTSENNQYQCRVKQDGNFVVERITLGMRENGEKFVANRTEIWSQPCKEGFIQMGENYMAIPDCFLTPVSVKAKNESKRSWPVTQGSALKLENDGQIKLYSSWTVGATGGNGSIMCNPYQK